MDAVFLMLTCCLSLAFTEPTLENEQMILQNTSSTVSDQDIVINSTTASSLNSSEHPTIGTTLISSTALTSAVDDNTSTTITPATSTSGYSPTSESTTTAVPFTSRTTQSTDVTTAPQTKTSVSRTSVSHSTSAAVITANTSVVNVTSQSVLSTQGVRLSVSERNLTITFSVMLGIFVLAVVAYKLHRCSQKLQFFHQPLNDTEDLNVYTADSDTLVTSGGLYEGHPIYDHVPPARQDESEFHLEFLH